MINTKSLSEVVRKKVDLSNPDDWIDKMDKVKHFSLSVRILGCIHNPKILLTIFEFEEVDNYEVVGGNFAMVTGFITQKYKLKPTNLFDD